MSEFNKKYDPKEKIDSKEKKRKILITYASLQGKPFATVCINCGSALKNVTFGTSKNGDESVLVQKLCYFCFKSKKKTNMCLLPHCDQKIAGGSLFCCEDHTTLSRDSSICNGFDLLCKNCKSRVRMPDTLYCNQCVDSVREEE